ncbi:AraC family transcriptional regulator [Spongiactinospora rosea]|uniref:AraC family transcriptional regulator n=2 Tax=Spongiactinospora rosea TaxID=2248750 RepID=A0A366LS97_9ACTN|nr:AraC family transcriptional regulator [Spongiactinospora rosea]
MHAHFERHVYHRHSHDAYSFGVTDAGRQAFTCRGSGYTSAGGMVMAFNPDDPHDGRAADELGFTYRIVHIGPELVTGALSQAGGRPGGPPLFAEPVVRDPALAAGLRRLHGALLAPSPALVRDELLDSVVLAMVRRAATRPPYLAGGPGRRSVALARRVRELLRDDPARDVGADALAAAAGADRFAVYRAFRAAYGMAPSDYQRQLRLRNARRLIAAGTPISEAAARAGFADQSHLTRWFQRVYGITPGMFQTAAGGAEIPVAAKRSQ